MLQSVSLRKKHVTFSRDFLIPKILVFLHRKLIGNGIINDLQWKL